MAIRCLMFRWLIPAAFVLPLWLVVGWAIFNAASSPWVLLPVLLIFAPSVLVGQLIATLLVRVRPSVRETQAVSWVDVGAFGAWHVLIILVGFYNQYTFAIALILAIIAAVVVFAVALSELWKESSRSRSALFTPGAGEPRPTESNGGRPMIVISETTPQADPREPSSRRFGSDGSDW